MTYKMNTYSFFGTCANESSHVTKVIKNIVSQNLHPKEVILVDSGDNNKFKDLKVFFESTDIHFKYIFEKLPRVEALNKAIDNVSSDYCFRFDTRTRFAANYAQESLKILCNKNLNTPFVGGVPEIVPECIFNSKYMC